MYDWQSWRTLVPLILGIFGIVGFVLYSIYISPEPLIRRSLFNTPTAITAYAATLIHGMIVWSLLYYTPLYFEVAKNYSPVNSGIAIFPFTFTVAPAAVVVGIIIAKTGRYRPSIVNYNLFRPSNGDVLTHVISGLVGSLQLSVWVFLSIFSNLPIYLRGSSSHLSLVWEQDLSSQLKALLRKLLYRMLIYRSLGLCSEFSLFLSRDTRKKA
jgi:hypothetical protein